ncbi:MAG: hypothetical protein ACOX2L_02875 [Anaerolineae bacterium]|jgi:hypothetical protein|nr:hypothetical protein [Chloroflexota bacterium]
MAGPTGRASGGAEGARVVRMSIVDGSPHLDPLSVRAFTPPSRREAEARGSLYVLLTTATAEALPPVLVGELMTRIGEAYYELSGSITRGMRSALLIANEVLFERNLRSDPAYRSLAGAVCVVVRGADLYVAQMGPAVAIVGSSQESRRYPDRSAWVVQERPEGTALDREPPLGLLRDGEPNLFHATCRDGDVVVLTTATLVREATDTDIAATTLQSSANDVIAGLKDLAHGRDVSLLIIRPPQATLDTRPLPPMGRGQSGPGIESSVSTGALDGMRPPAPLSEAASGSQPAGAAEPDGPTPRGSDAPWASAPLPDTAESDEAYADAWLEGAADRTAWQEPAPQEPEESAVAGAGWTDRDEVIKTGQPALDVSQFTEAVADRARRLRDSTESALLGVLPREVPPRPVEGEPRRVSVGGKALVAIAMIIPLVVLFTVVLARVQYDRARAAQHINAVNQAQYLYDQAMRQTDIGLKRDELYRALVVLDQSLAHTPDNADLQDLRRRTQHQIDQVEGVVPIYSFARLYYFEEGAASPTDSSRIAVNGKDVMVLHRGSDRVYRFYLNDVGDALQPVEANPVILRKGDVLDGETVTDLVDLTYMASDGSQTMSRFMVLDRAGRLLSYDPTRGMRSQPVGNADWWLSPQAIGSFFGNLYVLDPLLSRLFKYLPTNNEYVKAPLDYFDASLGIDLTGAVDMAIDSDVYVLYADGKILKFNNGQPVEFGMRGFYGNMRSPIAIHVSGGQGADATGYVYVADAGNSRVLQFTKEGDFVRQFRSTEAEPYMNDLRGIYVDEAERRMFLVSGQHFVLCSLPPISQ